MSSGNDREFVLYLALRKSRNNSRPYDFAASLDTLESRMKGEAEEQERSRAADFEKEENKSDQDELNDSMNDLIRRFSHSMAGFVPLTALGGSFPIALDYAFADRELKKRIDDYVVISDDEDSTIYGVPKNHASGLLRKIQEQSEVVRGFLMLPSATMLSMVAVYDSFISDLIRLLLKRRPDKYAHQDKKISVKEVLSMASFAEVIDSVIESELDSVMRKSHGEQISYIESIFNIEIKSKYRKWGRYVEIFERRNLIAHGGAVANNIYVSNCVANGFSVSAKKVGSQLSLSSKYIKGSIDVLTEFGVLVIFSLWRKVAPKGQEDIYMAIHYVTYDMIERRRYKVAASILDYLLDLNVSISDRTRRMMTINRANAHRKMGDVATAESIISKLDWGAVSPEFSICIAALNKDVEEFVGLMDAAHRSGKVSQEAFADWPVFDWVRDDQRVRQKFREMFGEELRASIVSPAGDQLEGPSESEAASA